MQTAFEQHHYKEQISFNRFFNCTPIKKASNPGMKFLYFQYLNIITVFEKFSYYIIYVFLYGRSFWIPSLTVFLCWGFSMPLILCCSVWYMRYITLDESVCWKLLMKCLVFSLYMWMKIKLGLSFCLKWKHLNYILQFLLVWAFPFIPTHMRMVWKSNNFQIHNPFFLERCMFT